MAVRKSRAQSGALIIKSKKGRSAQSGPLIIKGKKGRSGEGYRIKIVPGRTRVRAHIGSYIVTGTVIEDRGRIGAGGRQLLRVAVPMDDNVVAEYELPLDRLQVLPNQSRRTQ